MIRGAFNYMMFVAVCFPAICAFEMAMLIGGRSFRRQVRPQYVDFLVRKGTADLPSSTRRSGTKPKKRRRRK